MDYLSFGLPAIVIAILFYKMGADSKKGYRREDFWEVKLELQEAMTLFNFTEIEVKKINIFLDWFAKRERAIHQEVPFFTDFDAETDDDERKIIIP